jgi:hypothetical protein
MESHECMARAGSYHGSFAGSLEKMLTLLSDDLDKPCLCCNLMLFVICNEPSREYIPVVVERR